jgi:hypothetical protein
MGSYKRVVSGWNLQAFFITISVEQHVIRFRDVGAASES